MAKNLVHEVELFLKDICLKFKINLQIRKNIYIRIFAAYFSETIHHRSSSDTGVHMNIISFTFN